MTTDNREPTAPQNQLQATPWMSPKTRVIIRKYREQNADLLAALEVIAGMIITPDTDHEQLAALCIATARVALQPHGVTASAIARVHGEQS